MNHNRIGIVGWKDKSADLALALKMIAEWSKTHKEVSFCALESLKEVSPKNIEIVTEDALRKCDLLLAIGGDGTVLSTARIALGTSIPILGVNAGHVGFLAETRVEDLKTTLDLIQAGEFSTRNRMMLDAKIFREGKQLACETVLNEVHIRARALERMVNLLVEYNGRYLTEYWADSLLVSTPTGSTAYNLSANGPIIHPSTSAFVLTPLAPSSLSVRPLIIPASAICQISSVSDSSLNLVFDGRINNTLESHDKLVLSQSESVTTFIRMKNTGFVDALREKLGWTGKPKLA
jgi:NAD+ kinase